MGGGARAGITGASLRGGMTGAFVVGGGKLGAGAVGVSGTSGGRSLTRLGIGGTALDGCGGCKSSVYEKYAKKEYGVKTY